MQLLYNFSKFFGWMMMHWYALIICSGKAVSHVLDIGIFQILGVFCGFAYRYRYLKMYTAVKLSTSEKKMIVHQQMQEWDHYESVISIYMYLTIWTPLHKWMHHSCCKKYGLLSDCIMISHEALLVHNVYMYVSWSCMNWS